MASGATARSLLGPLFNKTSRPRDDDETVESLWSDWDIPRRMMQVVGTPDVYTTIGFGLRKKTKTVGVYHFLVYMQTP